MTKAYTVRGSEDGPIAVASSPAKAIAIAAAYVTANGGRAYEEGDAGFNMSSAAAYLRKRTCHMMYFCSKDTDFTLSAEIEKFDVNWYGGQDW